LAGGFTFEVQQELGEYLGWGFESKAFSWRVVNAARDSVGSCATTTDGP
jgi:hypothetical protein